MPGCVAGADGRELTRRRVCPAPTRWHHVKLSLEKENDGESPSSRTSVRCCVVATIRSSTQNTARPAGRSQQRVPSKVTASWGPAFTAGCCTKAAKGSCHVFHRAPSEITSGHARDATASRRIFASARIPGDQRRCWGQRPGRSPASNPGSSICCSQRAPTHTRATRVSHIPLRNKYGAAII